MPYIGSSELLIDDLFTISIDFDRFRSISIDFDHFRLMGSRSDRRSHILVGSWSLRSRSSDSNKRALLRVHKILIFKEILYFYGNFLLLWKMYMYRKSSYSADSKFIKIWRKKFFTEGSRSDLRSHFLAEIEIGQGIEWGIEIGS